MSRLSAIPLDLSLLPAPKATELLAEEVILDARLAKLKQLFLERGIAWDVDRTAHDPAVVISLNDTLREMLVAGAINDAVLSVMVGYAVDADLDQLGANYGVSRRDGEDNDSFRRQVLAAPDAFSSAGPVGAYQVHARNAHPDVAEVAVWSPARGEVVVAVQSRLGDGAASAELVGTVRRYLHQDHIKPLTDMVSVRSVEILRYALAVVAYVQPGATPAVIATSVQQSLAALVEARRRPGRDVPRSAVYAAATVGPVERVDTNFAGIEAGPGQLAVCTGIDVRVEVDHG